MQAVYPLRDDSRPSKITKCRTDLFGNPIHNLVFTEFFPWLSHNKCHWNLARYLIRVPGSSNIG